MFAPARPPERVRAEAELLRALETGGFPAERCAVADPISPYQRGTMLVTEYVPPADRLPPGRTFALLGGLLGALHERPGERFGAGGAWHHLSPTGTPRDEVAAAGALLEASLERVPVRELGAYDQLCDEVEQTDDCDDLPHALVHPDFVPANAIPTPRGWLVIVDWAGAGRGPRLWSLGFLLWAAGARSPRLVDAAVSRYRRHVQPEPEELARLEGAIRARPAMLECWAFCAGRRSAAAAAERISEANRLAATIADTACQAFANRT